MAEITNETTVDRKLFDIFEEGFQLFNHMDECAEPTNSPEVQSNIKKCIHLFEDATRLVSICNLFSANESYDEVNPNDLKYLLLPFFLGQLSLKICGGDRHNIVEVSEIYFRDFLARCEEYGLYETPKERSLVPADNANGEYANLTRMVTHRNSKLEQYRQKKELQDQIKQLKLVMEREYVDDEVKREFYIKLLKGSVMDAQEEVASIAQEKQILDYQKNAQHNNPDFEKRPKQRRPPPPLKPIIITKDEAQKAVYGLGYPSFPTMTVSEFYDQRVRDGVFPDPSKPKVVDPNSLQARAMRGDTAELDEQEEEDNDRRQEADDDEYIARARAKDDWKDEHRRGEGNRHNRS